MNSSIPQNYSAQIEEFQRQGFLVIPNALTSAEIARLNRAIDDDLRRNEREWVQFNDALTQTPDILSRTSEFDFAIENPAVLNFLRKLIGENVTSKSSW